MDIDVKFNGSDVYYLCDTRGKGELELGYCATAHELADAVRECVEVSAAYVSDEYSLDGWQTVRGQE